MIKLNDNENSGVKKTRDSNLNISDKHNKITCDRYSRLSERRAGYCGSICKNYTATKPPTGHWYDNGQVRCSTCMTFLSAKGVEIRKGRKVCKCCRCNVRTRPHNKITKQHYLENPSQPNTEFTYSIANDDLDSETENLESYKKATPAYSEEYTDKRSYSEFREFIEDAIRLQANYQLVMLKYLVSHKTADKGEIVESLAYYNNIDTSDMEKVKKLLKVPVYDVLVKHGFVNQKVKFGQKEYELNVQLSEYQQYEINDLLEKNIEEWNDEHGIPENQFKSTEIDWYKNQDLLIESSYWIWSVTPENWQIVKGKNIWGSKIPFKQIESRVSPDDFIIFYVVGTKSFKGIFQVDGHWYDDSQNYTWYDEQKEKKKTHISAVKLKPIILGTANLEELENLSVFKGKDQDLRNLVLKGGGGYPSNTGKPIPFDDFSAIQELLRRNSLLESPKEIESENNVKKPILSSSNQTESNEEIRKIQFDGTFYILSLPGKWINENGSKPGDPLAVSRLDSFLLQIKPMWLKVFQDEQGTQTENTTLAIKPDDEVRKIQFDGIVYFITLPNKWIVDMGLQQDDSVLVFSKSKTILEITPTKNESKTITLESVSTISKETEKKIDALDRKIFEINSDGITICEMKVLGQEVVKIGQILTNDELIQKFGVGNMGGIRYSSKNNLIVLCDTQSSHYSDKIDSETGIILYTGEGQTGDQDLTGGNSRIVNSSNLALFYFVEVSQEPGMRKRGALDNIYKFVGKVKYLKHSLKVENDTLGNPGIVIKFLLEVEK